MPAATKPTGGGVLSVRGKDLFIGTAGPMAFENLINPDEYQGDENFTVTQHLNVPQVARLGELIDAQVVTLAPLFEKMFADENAKAAVDGKPQKKVPPGGWVWPVGADWVADHLKEAGEKSTIKDPIIKWKNSARFKNRDGEMQLKTMRAYDAEHNVLDLPSLKLGRGSIIQPVLIPGLFINPLLKHPTLSFRLQGVVVIELKQRGGGAGGSLGGRVREEDLAGLGGAQVQDLSAYAAKGTTQAGNTPSQRPVRDEDLDDEIPF